MARADGRAAVKARAERAGAKAALGVAPRTAAATL